MACPIPSSGLSRARASSTAIRAAKAALDEEESKERNRLLYVAMTRARDRLYVAGFESKKGRDRDCWYELISQGLEGALERAERPDGLQVRRLSASADCRVMRSRAASAPPSRPPPRRPLG